MKTSRDDVHHSLLQTATVHADDGEVLEADGWQTFANNPPRAPYQRLPLRVPFQFCRHGDLYRRRPAACLHDRRWHVNVCSGRSQ